MAAAETPPPHEKHPIQILAEESRYEEPREALKELCTGGADRETGEYLTPLAIVMLVLNRALAWWFYDAALTYLHAWGSQATSGGDRAARMLVIGR